MSYFSDASLVFIPSAQKSGKAYSIKPTDGTGDLTFTRSNDTATRVASNGLIEKVRTNLVLQSETFDNASWTKSASSVTANTTTAPDGTSTADTWTADGTAATHGIIQSGTATLTNGTTYSTSIYAKKGTNDFIQIIGSSSPYGSLNVFANFDLNNGVVGTVGSLVTATIQDAGNGWYRCTMIAAAAATTSTNTFIVQIVSSASAARGESNSLSTSVFLWGAQLEVSDFGATDYIPTTTAAVSVGPVANVPRLDYLNSTCPKLILEPRRTNLCVNSENLDNAVWTKVNSTVTANNTTAPDGYLGADRINEDTANNAHGVERVTSGAAGTYTFSIFIKKGTRRYAGMRAVVNGYSNRYFSLLDLDTGLIVSNNTVGTGVTWTSSVETYGNGWYRLIITGNHTSSNITLLAALSNSANPTYTAGVPYYQGSTSENGFFWGAQIELGAYATSYIPTLGAAVTRGADACSKTGISSLIGQTEGVIFADFVVNARAQGSNILNSEKNTTASFFLSALTNGNIDAGLYASGSPVGRITAGSVSVGQRAKVAYAYKSGSCALYINGTQVGTSSGTFTLPSTLDDLFLNDPTTYFTYQENVSFNQALLFTTRLTNAQLAELTTL